LLVVKAKLVDLLGGSGESERLGHLTSSLNLFGLSSRLLGDVLGSHSIEDGSILGVIHLVGRELEAGMTCHLDHPVQRVYISWVV
jgi:hypothetical protein